MTVLALDLGTKTGFAYRHENGRIVSGVWNFTPRRFDGGGMRYLKFQHTLAALWIGIAYSAVYYEEVRNHKGVDAAHVYGGLLGILTSYLEQKEIPYEGVPVGQIKKFWTGKGNADKAAMIGFARQRGFDPEDDNEADALALLHFKDARAEDVHVQP